MDCQNGNGIAPNVGEKIKENTEGTTILTENILVLEQKVKNYGEKSIAKKFGKRQQK